MMYTPDRWVLLKITTPTEILYKVFGMWSGGYLDGDSWRMNSGIESIAIGDTYKIFGASGSCYNCSRTNYGLTGYGSGILDSFMAKSPAIEVVDEHTVIDVFDRINND